MGREDAVNRRADRRRQTLTAAAAAARARRAGTAFARLVRVMNALRAPGGCPWDRKQTHASLAPFLLEETYEAIDAIDRRDLDALRGELGDVLFQCVFQSQVAAEDGRFEMADVVTAVTAKLIGRHPHVFAPSGRPLAAARRRTGRVRTSAAVIQQWEQIKAAEQARAGVARRVLAGIPRSMPALLRAHEIGTRVAAVGFDWKRPADVVDKIDEEVRELRDALGRSRTEAALELGDLLFSIANLARQLGLEPESALRRANDKFTGRFDAVEAHLERRGSSVHAASPDDMERAWAAAKRSQKRRSPATRRRAGQPGRAPTRRA
jgi:nucleoside triphosphate diphosphatase